jgi:mRNA interferase YafQ
MYALIRSKQFQKSFKKLVKNGLKKKNIDELARVIDILASGGCLAQEYRDHKLHGEYEGYRECHIRGDLLLIYQIVESELVLVLINIGSHSELF